MDTWRGLVELTGRADAVVFPDICASCAAPAGGQRLPDPSLLRTTLTMFRTVAMLPAVGFVLTALFMLPPRADDLAMFGFTVGSFLLGLACVWAAWRLSRHHRVRKPSSVTGAFDFSDDSSGTFERRRRTYRLANPAFGEAFAAANAERAR